MITITETIDINKVRRLQNYAKLFAHSLRFRYCYESFDGKWSVSYEVNAEDYDKINEWEEKVQKRVENLKKEELKKMNIFQKVKKIFIDFLNAL